MPEAVESSTDAETVTAVARLLDSAARDHADRGEGDLARRLRLRARTVRGLLER